MAKSNARVPSLKLIVVGSCAGVVIVILLINILWAPSNAYGSALLTSYRPSFSVRNDSLLSSTQKFEDSNGGEQLKNASNYVDIIEHERNLVQLDWEEMSEAPVPRLDGAAIQIGHLLYVFAGYGTIDIVHSHVDVYNIPENKWEDRFDMPKDMAHSHLGMVTDGRYIYIVSGQYGPQCRSPIALNFVLDTTTRKWSKLPPLPKPRYAPATQLWRGRLHVMGGSKENRHEPGLEHWSLAVKNGKALESEWREEIPIPRGGPHRACVVANDQLYVIGGQEGDFMAKPGSPIFKCARRKEVVYSDVYMLSDGPMWKMLPPMPLPDSHIEFAWVLVNNTVLIAGGTTEKNPATKKMVLVGEILKFDLNTLEWTIVGKMVCRMKTVLAAYWDGWLYITSGQRDRGVDDPSPKKVIGKTWRTKLNL